MEQNVNQTVFALLKSALWGTKRSPLCIEGVVNWDEVYQELRAQSVAALPTDLLAELSDLEPTLKQEWMLKTIRSIGNFQKVMREQQSLRELLGREQIPFVVLKGAAAAMYYPRPEYRAMGDIDIIVRPEDFDRANKLLSEAEFKEIDEDKERHVELAKNGVVIELHRYFADMKDSNMSQALDTLIYESIDNTTDMTIEQFNVPVLPRLVNGLVLLAHINHHMEAGLGLRQIIDWMLFVDRELNTIWWEEEFAFWTDKIGLRTLAITVTRMCQIYLGLREDGLEWCRSADEDLCHALMQLTMERGNFGRKQEEAGGTISILNTMSQVSNIFKFLQDNGKINWKWLKKHPIFTPFAWVYQIYYYTRKGLQRKRPFKQLWRDMRARKHVDDILNRLGITVRMKDKFE